MPRTARVKTTESIFHIMCRSIKEVKLFKSSEDKLRYIDFIKRYQEIHRFKIYSYCFMDNHVHLILDANGADVSQIMHGINFTYARYYNKKYKRYGHLFQDRFKSKVIDSERYLITASAYIHNNPIDIKKYEKSPENYKFSSLAAYLGIKSDPFGLIEQNFILSLFGDNYEDARIKYYNFVFWCSKEKNKEIEFENEGTLYRNQRVIVERNHSIKSIIDYLSKKMCMPKELILLKNERKAVKARAILVLLFKSFCNYNAREICTAMGDITQASISRLTGIGLSLIREEDEFKTVFENFESELVQI